MESKTSITNANAKISDSGYSNSCSNSISQRSSTSKSHNSESTSSRSSGYYGAATGNRSNEDNNFHPPRRNKSKEHKKRKYKFNTIPIKEQKTEEISLNDIKEEIIIDTNKLPEKEEKTADFSSIEVKPEQKTEESQVPLEKQWTFSMDSSKEKSQLNIENRLDTSTEFLKNTQKESNENSENGFCCVISLYDGIVLYTTPSLTSVLGFPKDMWLGRSFIDFVHPKDRETFSSQIATEIALPLVNTPGKINDLKNYLYVCLRKYKNLKSGFNISDKPVNYQAFQLTVSIQHLNTSGDIKKQLDGKNGKFLVVFASPVYSAYKVPNEEVHFENFGMRHTAGCKFSHVDPDIVKNLGFLPQDLLGKSIFDFYHPEDMSFLKEIYESIVAMRQMTGSVFRSKPYRFAVQNGGFVTLETEWSSFVNPWSRRMEYVIGLHKVLQGPKDPDVFAKNQNEELNFISDDVLTKSKTIQGEILLLLNKELSLPLETSKQEVFKRCKDLAHFMESLMGNKKNSELHIEMPSCISEKDFVMLGEISPHHDYYDSKSSSETPPSYNQLNYNDNIERFFKSKPKTTLSSDESSERPSIEQSSTTQGEKNDPNTISNNQKCESPVENSGYSGSGSAGNLSSVSNPMAESGDTSVTNTTSNESFKPLHLTEDVLTKHNKNMEQIMIQRHKEIKQHSKELSGNKSNSKKGKKKFNRKHKASKNKSNHGVKRRISQSWEGDQKNSRQKYKIDQSVGNDNIPEVNLQQNNQSFSNNFYLANDLYHQRMNEANLWPPFPIKMSPVNENLTANLAGFPGGMFPFYYIPTPQNPLDRPTTSQQNLQVQYFPSILFPTSPVIPIPLVQVQAPSTYIKTDQQTNNCPNSNYLVATESACDSKLISPNTTIFHGPPSQATSIKVEHGSNLDSVASASVVNKAFSVSSRKDLVLQSVCSQDSPIVSPLDGEVHMEKFQSLQIKNNKEQLPISKQESNTTNDDESWFSSSYSSLLKTDYGSGSNDESNNKKIQSDDDVLIKEKENVSLRKRHPPWLNSVNVTSEFIYQYQMAIKGLEDVLESDLEILKDMNQPSAINEQLEELYKEMELQGLSFKLKLEEGFSSSSCSSSGEENRANASKSTTNTIRKKKKSRNSFMKAFLYEENSSFPQSDEQDSNN